MAVGKVSKRSVDATRPTSKDRYLWDTAIKGFALKVTPRGTRTYLFEYKDNERKTRRVTIGRHGVITAEQARDCARGLAAKVELGGDPAEEKSNRRATPTIKELADQWMRDHVRARRKPKTVNDYQGWLDRHILPKIGAKKVVDVKPQDVERLISGLADRPTTGNRVHAVLSSMFSFAIRKHLIRDNPARGIEKNDEVKRDRHLSAEEIHRLGVVLNEAKARGENQSGIDLIRFLLLSGVRRGEAETLRWDYVDFASGKLNLPDSKTGKKTVPLGEPAVNHLAEIRGRQREAGAYDHDEFVFPGKEGHLIGLPKMWRKWRKEAGFEELRIHDLRHSYASFGASGGIPLFVLGGVLGHKSSVTTERYAHLQDDPAKAAADTISAAIAAAFERPSNPRQ